MKGHKRVRRAAKDLRKSTDALVHWVGVIDGDCELKGEANLVIAQYAFALALKRFADTLTRELARTKLAGTGIKAGTSIVPLGQNYTASSKI